MNHKEQANHIEAFGDFLERTQKGKVLSPEKELEIRMEWNISEKTFTRLFSDYRKTTKLRMENEKKDTSNGKRVRDLTTGKEYGSVQKAANATGEKVHILRERLRLGKSCRLEYV